MVGIGMVGIGAAGNPVVGNGPGGGGVASAADRLADVSNGVAFALGGTQVCAPLRRAEAGAPPAGATAESFITGGNGMIVCGPGPCDKRGLALAALKLAGGAPFENDDPIPPATGAAAGGDEFKPVGQAPAVFELKPPFVGAAPLACD